MSYLDPPGWPESREPDHDDPYDRQRARHADAAPDAYPGYGEPGADDRFPATGGRPGGPRPGRRRRRDEPDPGAGWPEPESARPGGTWPPGEPLDAWPAAEPFGAAAPAEPAAAPWVPATGARPDPTSGYRSRPDPGPRTEQFWPVDGAGGAAWAEPGATAEIPAVPGGPEQPPEPGPAALYPDQPDRAGSAAAAAAKPAGRAGRNLPAAIGVGLTLGAIVVAALFIWPPAFVGVVVAAICIATWELVRAVGANDRARPPLVPLVGGGAGMAVLAWFGGPEALVLGLVATVLAALLWRLADGPAGYRRDLTASVLIAVYLPFLGGFAVLLLTPHDGPWRVLVTLAGVVLSDTGGYIAGVFLGKHPMAPSVSPKKSWEGFGGSLLAAAVGGALLLFFLLHVAWWYGVLFGLCVAAASVVGDLAESLLKRDLGIKDMSNLLPGHGGLMDRLDSVLFALPAAYTVLALVAPAVR